MGMETALAASCTLAMSSAVISLPFPATATTPFELRHSTFAPETAMTQE